MSTASREKSDGARESIKVIPPTRQLRDTIRSAAGRLMQVVSRAKPMTRHILEERARRVLDREGLPAEYRGFAMVAISNAFWSEQFASTPYDRRLLLLPHCLRDAQACRGDYSPLGLSCAGCGACELAGLSEEAEGLGYKVLIAEGTPAVVQLILSGRADAMMGVACLDSLEEAFEGLAQLGIPHVAAPLLVDGCEDTVAELDVVRRLMRRRAGSVGTRTRSYVPLLRAAEGLFRKQTLEALLAGDVNTEDRASRSADDPLKATEAIALKWLRRGGKRFRPFVTLASYAAMQYGPEALDPASDPSEDIPPAVKKAAVAIETLHKASLVHDDIEDEDPFRYGQHTLHREHGLSTALNVGDYLIGLGYRLVSSIRDEVGAGAATDILAHLSAAHMKLTRGQGAEIQWGADDADDPTARDIQAVYALKTAPAFEAAMYAGIRLAEPSVGSTCPKAVRRFCRYVGAAYQVKNDLRDWEPDGKDKVVLGRDAVTERPTILRVFAMQQSEDDIKGELGNTTDSGEERVGRLRQVFEREGAFDKARALLDRYRERAVEQAESVKSGSLTELMRFIVEIVL